MPIGKKTNEQLNKLISDLKKKAYENKAPIWKDVARRLEKPNSSWAEVNLRHVAQYTKSGDTVIVPGKLLGLGEISEPITVAAYNFSESARKKIDKVGGKSISLPELIKINPKGTGIKIIG